MIEIILFIIASILFLLFCFGIGIKTADIAYKENFFKAFCLFILSYFIAISAYTFGYFILVPLFFK